VATNPVFELVQRETGLWVILRRTGKQATIVETGHVDRDLAALDLASYVSSRTLSPIGQGWLRVADRLASNVKSSRNLRKGRGQAATTDILARADMLRLLLEQGYRCPISGSYFTHDAFDGGVTGPFQPSVDRIEAHRGYERDNVRIVCLLVNLAMSAWGEEPLRKIAERISGRDRDGGQWAAFDQVLNHLNTIESLTVSKSDIYAAVMAMRPKALRETPGLRPDQPHDTLVARSRLRLTSCEALGLSDFGPEDGPQAAVSHCLHPQVETATWASAYEVSK
jgi:hypothetical protein